MSDPSFICDRRRNEPGRRSTDVETCGYHGDLMEKLGELRANQMNVQRELAELSDSLKKALGCMEAATKTMQKEQITKSLGKIVLWAATVTGALLIAEYVRSCLR